MFHNDKWEKRLHKVNNENVIKRHASSYRNSFVYASVASTILFFCLLDYKSIGVFEISQIIICIILVLWFNAYVFWQKDNDNVKQTYINAWKKIKKEEKIQIKKSKI